MSMAHLKFINEKLGNNFYVYSGSQTQPPCHSTNWIVSRQNFDVLQEQIDQLKNSVDLFENSMQNNARNIQDSSS